MKNGWISQLLRELTESLTSSRCYEKMQRKNMDIMVPLRKLWEALKTANKEQDSSVSISDFTKFEIT